MVFQKGSATKDKGTLNYVGLGQLDLDAKNTSGAQLPISDKGAAYQYQEKDVHELLLIAKAYIKSENPNCKKGIQIINKALLIDDKNAQAFLLLGEAQYGNNNQTTLPCLSF